jgi:polysaccharide biosynthesis transport protein
MPTHASDTSGIGHGLRVLRRNAWIVVLTTLLITGLGAGFSLLQAPLYESSAQVFLGSSQSLPSTLANIQAYYSDPTRAANTQASLAQVPAVAQRALQNLHVTDRTSQDLLGSAKVTTSPNSDILTFTVSDRNRVQAQRLATAFAAAYVQYRGDLDTAAIVRARSEVESRLADLQKRHQTHSLLYRNLSKNDQQLQTLQQLQGANAALVRNGDAAVKVQPKPVRNGVLAFVLGLVLGVALAFLRDTLNTRVRSAQEAEERLGLPLLGRIPELPRKRRAGSQLVMFEEPHALAAESYRVLGTNLGFANLDRGAVSVMVTSAIRGEGKSTTVANLAVALARAGRRVVLLDLDLRGPSIGRLFNIQGRPGLTNVALGDASLDQAMTSIELHAPSANGKGAAPRNSLEGTLEVLTSGPAPPNPAEFAGSPTIANILAQLTERADIVLVDAPPLLQLSDAMSLTARVDAVLVIARLSLIRRATLNELKRALRSAPVAQLGFVLTDATADERHGYYYQQYGGAYDEPATREPQEVT